MAKKILFIEDEPDQIMMLQTRLEANGFQVISAPNGEEGIKKVREEKPDLILLDIVMPKMNGYEVCKCLKGNPNTSHIPIIAVTASGAKELEEKCRSTGINDIVKKPYESADLLNKIKRLLSE